MMENFSSIRHAVLSTCLLLTSASLVSAQKADTTAPPPSPQAWEALVIPDSADTGNLESFLEATKKRQPSNPEQYVEMQRALRTVSKKIMELNGDKASIQYKKAEGEFVNASVMLLGNEGPEAQRKTFERFRDYLKERTKIEFAEIQMAILAGNNLEQLADYSLAKEAYTTFATIFREKNDPSLAEIIPMLEANAKRLDLPGKPFNLVGSTMSGEDFDIAGLKGKLVLIFFWASKSGACEQEFPFLLSTYNKYKERGFEIVGIGLDDKKEQAQSFIKRLEVPWINLWESRKNGVSKVMESFGISAIPTFFLIDKDGMVVTIEARGAVLTKSLETLLPATAPEPTKP